MRDCKRGNGKAGDETLRNTWKGREGGRDDEGVTKAGREEVS